MDGSSTSSVVGAGDTPGEGWCIQGMWSPTVNQRLWGRRWDGVGAGARRTQTTPFPKAVGGVRVVPGTGIVNCCFCICTQEGLPEL